MSIHPVVHRAVCQWSVDNLSPEAVRNAAEYEQGQRVTAAARLIEHGEFDAAEVMFQIAASFAAIAAGEPV